MQNNLTTAKICPKCSYERKPAETVPAYQCPSCGVIYQKFLDHVSKKRGNQPALKENLQRTGLIFNTAFSLTAAFFLFFMLPNGFVLRRVVGVDLDLMPVKVGALLLLMVLVVIASRGMGLYQRLSVKKWHGLSLVVSITLGAIFYFYASPIDNYLMLNFKPGSWINFWGLSEKLMGFLFVAAFLLMMGAVFNMKPNIRKEI